MAHSPKLSFRLPPSLLALVDGYAEDFGLDRTGALRSLLRLGLQVRPKAPARARLGPDESETPPTPTEAT